MQVSHSYVFICNTTKHHVNLTHFHFDVIVCVRRYFPYITYLQTQPVVLRIGNPEPRRLRGQELCVT